MTRRKLIHKMLGAGAVILAGITSRISKVMPRRFTWAVKSRKYPGGFRAPNNIFRQSKWGG